MTSISLTAMIRGVVTRRSKWSTPDQSRELNHIDTIIPAAILRSSFFKRYYLVFWKDDTEVHAKRAARLLKWLEVDFDRDFNGRCAWSSQWPSRDAI